MNYELAKELKEAGFPQKERSLIVGNEDCFVPNPTKLDDYTYVPTLSELIEAVKKVRLRITLNGFEDHWNAHCSTTESRSGSTPEEAVARLLLALNKKP